ncbi:hypothetical protein N8Z19_02500 [Saprospiraceae bacterium]|nr:hypothetical protein [Saprospiraceae bacterium]
MKTLLGLLFVLSISVASYSQNNSCDEIKRFIESNGTYLNHDLARGSTSISSIYFYEHTPEDSYTANYYAIVKFTSSLTTYIYAIDYYSYSSYMTSSTRSAGEKFHVYIREHNMLDCH